MARILTYLDGPMWRLVRELYLQDKVIEALQEAEKLGGQDSNDLYAEAEAREKGEQVSVRGWLRVEAIRAEVSHSFPAVLDIVDAECESLSRRFGWDNRESTLVTLLPNDVEEPWMPGRWGYFVDKVPYDKICLPYHLAFDLPDLRRTIQHEFMHGITLNLGGGHAPRWLSEAMSTYAEGRLDRHAWIAWQREEAEWLPPRALEAMTSTDNRNEGLLKSISFAYSQANVMARYLAAQGGDAKLGALLRAIGDESFLHNLEIEIKGRSRTDAALRKVYGFSERGLFDLSLSWVKSTSPPAGYLNLVLRSEQEANGRRASPAATG